MNPRLQRLSAEGAIGESWTRITNYDPKRSYKWVNSADGAQGVEYHETVLGYQVELKSPDGVRALHAGRKLKDGDEIVISGQVLMSIGKEELAEIERYGADGTSGLEAVARLERAMAGGRDPRTSKRRVLVPDASFDPDIFNFDRTGRQAAF